MSYHGNEPFPTIYVDGKEDGKVSLISATDSVSDQMLETLKYCPISY